MQRRTRVSPSCGGERGTRNACLSVRSFVRVHCVLLLLLLLQFAVAVVLFFCLLCGHLAGQTTSGTSLNGKGGSVVPRSTEAASASAARSYSPFAASRVPSECHSVASSGRSRSARSRHEVAMESALPGVAAEMRRPYAASAGAKLASMARARRYASSASRCASSPPRASATRPSAVSTAAVGPTAASASRTAASAASVLPSARYRRARSRSSEDLVRQREPRDSEDTCRARAAVRAGVASMLAATSTAANTPWLDDPPTASPFAARSPLASRACDLPPDVPDRTVAVAEVSDASSGSDMDGASDVRRGVAGEEGTVPAAADAAASLDTVPGGSSVDGEPGVAGDACAVALDCTVDVDGTADFDDLPDFDDAESSIGPSSAPPLPALSDAVLDAALAAALAATVPPAHSDSTRLSADEGASVDSSASIDRAREGAPALKRSAAAARAMKAAAGADPTPASVPL
mmetsp:Transcript_7062/g.22613  ORF Transcript_7062/g.22613 Transcript_7062/m.22613 type:complete len:463 (-) Transcript_7062:1111-2499(-)